MCTPNLQQTIAQPIRIVVADDHPIVRAGIIHELALYPDLQVVGEAANGEQAVQQVYVQAPDVLLLDIGMPGLPVEQAVEQVRAISSASRILMLTAHNDTVTVLTMLKAGATGYLLKDEDVSMIAVAARAVACGDRWMSPTVTALLVHEALRGGEPNNDELSQRETEVLQQLAGGKDNQEIGKVLHISERTVRFHLRNIYDKLGVRRGGAIAWGIRHGLGTSIN